jgi:hypothetical protein
MKKLIPLLAIAIFAAHTVLAQGTIQFQNSFLSPIYTNTDTAFGKVNASLGLDFGLFWGTAPGSVTNFAGIETIGVNPGILKGNLSFVINGALTGDTDYFQVVAWDSVYGNDAAGRMAAMYGADYWYTESQILPFRLGAIGGPGTVIFTSPSTPGYFHGLDPVTPARLVLVTPEPTTLAIGGLGAAGLLYFRRRK